MKDLKIYFFCSTHWDREWYIPFQEFRLKLVDTINDLMDILENNSEYKLFCLDGSKSYLSVS